MKKILFSAIIIAATIGCSKKNTEVTNDGQREIRLSSSVSDLTGTGKAASKAAFNSTDAVVGLQFLRSDGSQPGSIDGSTLVVGNRTDDDTFITFTTPQYYEGANTAFFLGFYPACTEIKDDAVAWVLTDSKSDIMYTKTTENNTGIVNAGTDAVPAEPVLTFAQALTQIAVVCKSEAGNHDAVKGRWGQIEYIKLKDALTNVFFTISYDGKPITTGPETASIAFAQADYTTDFAAIDLPDDANTTENAAGMFCAGDDVQTFILLIKTANQIEREVTIDLGADKKLEAGKKHIVTLTFNTRGIQVKTTIADWGEGAPGASEVN